MDISNNFKWNVYDANIAKNLITLEGTPEAIKYFEENAAELSDYAYWFLLSTLWVSYSGKSDLNLWRRLFSSGRSGKRRSMMKPSEHKEYERLPWFITAYRAHRNNESDWISYTLDKSIAFRFARERGTRAIKEYKIKKSDVEALFLRRNEAEIIVVNKDNAEFIREHIFVNESISISPWKEDTGFVCLPLKINVPNPKNKDWKLVNCPICGMECWEPDAAREILKLSNMQAACTICSLKRGVNHGKLS